ncbi:MAG: Gfo/Idh/MocA family oxidoreductase [Hyphomicrobiales bacterium]|nr:Gfo/Idh/MocA family oxidoreductase [Hyphomicrobiales bacterium]
MSAQQKPPAINKRRIRLGMVGGGEGAFIGAVHRLAARMDDHYEFVAGALSSTPEKSRRSGAALNLDEARVYDDFASMAKAEAARPDGIEAVSIVTPNHMHKAPILTFLKAGIDVICDKPLTISLDDALEIEDAVKASKLVFALTHNYSAYPLVRQARAMVQAGDLGAVRLVHVEYPQDWLCTPQETSGNKQAEWRTDPARSGAGGCIGDIGTHAFQLADFITNLPLEELAADLSSFSPGRRVDDNVQIMLRYQNGARGMLWASQVAPGHDNGLKIRVYGEKGSLEWMQAQPNSLQVARLGAPIQIYARGGAGLGAGAALGSRLPPGHPEGYLEAFGNLYSEAAVAIRARRMGQARPADLLVPGIDDAVKGMAFIDAALTSSKNNAGWVKPRR